MRIYFKILNRGVTSSEYFLGEEETSNMTPKSRAMARWQCHTAMTTQRGTHFTGIECGSRESKVGSRHVLLDIPCAVPSRQLAI